MSARRVRSSGPIRAAFVAVCLVAASPMGSVGATACWQPPVVAAVADPFRAPECRWCPGNRGIEYATQRGRPVRAVASGAVAYSGRVAGVAYLVVRHADGRRATYGNLQRSRLSRGDRVLAGQLIGLTTGPFHFGLREGDRYVDPAPFLGRVTYRPRLVPVHGGPRPPGASRLVCD